MNKLKYIVFMAFCLLGWGMHLLYITLANLLGKGRIIIVYDHFNEGLIELIIYYLIFIGLLILGISLLKDYIQDKKKKRYFKIL